MQETATITSKRQLTIPSTLYKQLGLKEGQKVTVIEADGRLIITPAERLVEELAGSLNVPRKWQDKSMEKIIEESKVKYFKSKYKYRIK